MPIVPKPCPICGVETNYVYNIEESDKGQSQWFRCTCGVIFQEEFNPKYTKQDLKETEDNQRHAVKIYAPLIEELTYGRMFLHPQFEESPEVMKEMEDRGWITWGINEKCKNPGGHKYKGNILEYDFDITVPNKELFKEIGVIKRHFSVIWLQHIVERQKDPIGYLKRAYELLDETGVLYISTPDIEFIHKQGVKHWQYWRKKENNVLWSERALKRELEKIGFKVVMSRRNYSARFMGHYDLHFICQKNYF